jgi:hypothetical protein
MQAKGAILNQQVGPIFYRELAPFCSGIDTCSLLLSARDGRPLQVGRAPLRCDVSKAPGFNGGLAAGKEPERSEPYEQELGQN